MPAKLIPRRVALFAAGDVGEKIIRLFASSGIGLSTLVLDAKEDPKRREELSSLAHAERIVLHTDPLPAGEYDLGILCWWPYIVKEELLNRCKLGFLNFHPSLLPYNRGKHPNFWSLVEQVPFGVTLHWVNSTIDGGAIAYQREIPKKWSDTGKTLYQRGQIEIVNLFADHLHDIVFGEIPRIAQPEGHRVHFAKELEPASQIDLDATYTGRELLNLLRARTFLPWPACRFEDENRSYQVRVEIEEIV